jgi:flavin reductase (DIM6/NTAB) family NADH-FMN oxidoreductase RutF
MDGRRAETAGRNAVEPSTDSQAAADAELFRQAFRRYASTVVVVTYFDGATNACGMTATSMCSLSASPPSLVVCINRASRAHAEISARGRYGVNMLAIGQRNVALHCSRPGMDKRLRDSWLTADTPPDSTPRLASALAHLECAVEASYEAHSHSLFVGRIERVWLNPVESPPLLYHGGAYGQLESIAELSERLHWELPD